ncbi:major capsid protein [Sigmofec virus UA08Rod_5080]|uniref:Major capsid protein n=1 Tax=Sigmofec virus UA08Rod_5080 TaxID=2929414 RepID=A0A976N186_9VIRU|nr:major capsid protein [Sigmofec virus UA08Rod_5080]
MGVFSKNNQPEGQVKRNAFDGSFQNNLTMKMGYLYPCLCKEVVPGDTFKIDAAFGLRFMPTAFPIQTKIKAHLDLFYVRNRNLWKGFQNYYTGVGVHDGFPTLSPNSALSHIKTGSLGDYLGLPSTIIGRQVDNMYYPLPLGALIPDGSKSINGFVIDGNVSDIRLGNKCVLYRKSDRVQVIKVKDIKKCKQVELRMPDSQAYLFYEIPTQKPVKVIDNRLYGLGLGVDTTTSNKETYVNLMTEYLGIPMVYIQDEKLYFNGIVAGDENIDPETDIYFGIYSRENIDIPSNVWTGWPLISFAGFDVDNSTVTEATDVLNSCPFEISALPFRAYEQIYNSFYRDDRNNPYEINGEYDPNVFIPNSDGGVDYSEYVLRKRNWEQDFLTTALPSPQYGAAPLVGLTSSGVASFTDEDGNTISSQLSVGEDGDTVVGFTSTNSPQVNRTLVQLANTGISINDLRGVNSLQRYLETKYRIGLRYRDQMKAHFGIDIKADILDMPEFIGSISQRVDVTQINQTSYSDTDPLGSYAGQLSAVGGNKSNIQKYCDEPGYIIGIISVVPVPCYSQLCPKHFLKTNENLEFWYPEFNHLGFQPIKYSEVCPLQAAHNNVSLDDTFGYQRAWYDYLSNTDEVHGQFRTTLNNFVLARVFNTVPSLNPEFLTIDPDNLNDIFTVNEVNGEPVDTILGQIHFDITMMRPISRFGVPRLE